MLSGSPNDDRWVWHSQGMDAWHRGSATEPQGGYVASWHVQPLNEQSVDLALILIGSKLSFGSPDGWQEANPGTPPRRKSEMTTLSQDTSTQSKTDHLLYLLSLSLPHHHFLLLTHILSFLYLLPSISFIGTSNILSLHKHMPVYKRANGAPVHNCNSIVSQDYDIALTHVPLYLNVPSVYWKSLKAPISSKQKSPTVRAIGAMFIECS